MPLFPARINTPLRNYFFYKLGELTGQTLTDGYLIFYDESTYPSGFLTVYQDPDLTVPYTTTPAGHVGLDSDGGIAPIYLQDAAYAIEVYSVEDDLQFTVRNYTGALFEVDTPESTNYTPNLFPDGQFNLPTFNAEPPSPPIGVTTITESGWQFELDGTGGTDILEFIRFSVGDSDVVQNPLNMLHYQVTVAPSGETVKRVYAPFKYVRTLEGIEVTFSFYARGTGSSAITPFYEQFFGTGGSPSTTNTVDLTPVSLTGTWTLYNQTFVIASAGGTTLGTNNDDFLRVGINFTLNGLTDVYLTNMLLEEGNQVTQYPYQTFNQIQQEFSAANPTGMIGWFSLLSAPIGWLECDHREVSRITYVNLFQATSFRADGDTSTGTNLVSNITTNNISGSAYYVYPGATTSAAATITVESTASLTVGMLVTSANFANVVSILTIDSATQVTVSANATATSTVDTNFYYTTGTEFTSDKFTGVAHVLTVDAMSNEITVSKNANASGTSSLLFCINGAGDGVSTFNTPDYTDCSPMGRGGVADSTVWNTVGATGGERSHFQLEKEVGQHRNTSLINDNFISDDPDDPEWEPASGGGSVRLRSAPSTGYNVVATSAFNIIHPVRVDLACIKT